MASINCTIHLPIGKRAANRNESFLPWVTIRRLAAPNLTHGYKYLAPPERVHLHDFAQKLSKSPMGYDAVNYSGYSIRGKMLPY